MALVGIRCVRNHLLSPAVFICNDRYLPIIIIIILKISYNGIRPFVCTYYYFSLISSIYNNIVIVHSFPQEDLLIHGDSVYDMIDKQDHQAVQTELSRSQTSAEDQGCKRMFLCRMNVSRNARRQMRFGDQKVIKTISYVGIIT